LRSTPIAIDVVDSGGDGTRRVDVIDSTVGPGFAMAAQLSGAHASFRQVALQSAGGFQLQRNVHGGGPDLTVASLQFMPLGGRLRGPYLRLIASSAAGAPLVVRHEDVALDPEFSLIEADREALASLVAIGSRLLLGPVQVAEANPYGLAGLAGDIFRPRDLLQSQSESGWPTEWWCVASGPVSEAVWVPVCRRPPPYFIEDGSGKGGTVGGKVGGSSFLDWPLWSWLG